MNAHFPVSCPPIRHTSSTREAIFIKIAQAPLQRPLAGSRFWSIVTGQPIFNLSFKFKGGMTLATVFVCLPGLCEGKGACDGSDYCVHKC